MWFIHFSISYLPDTGFFFCEEKFSFNARSAKLSRKQAFFSLFSIKMKKK